MRTRPGDGVRDDEVFACSICLWSAAARSLSALNHVAFCDSLTLVNRKWGGVNHTRNTAVSSPHVLIMPLWQACVFVTTWYYTPWVEEWLLIISLRFVCSFYITMPAAVLLNNKLGCLDIYRTNWFTFTALIASFSATAGSSFQWKAVSIKRHFANKTFSTHLDASLHQFSHHPKQMRDYSHLSIDFVCTLRSATCSVWTASKVEMVSQICPHVCLSRQHYRAKILIK